MAALGLLVLVLGVLGLELWRWAQQTRAPLVSVEVAALDLQPTPPGVALDWPSATRLSEGLPLLQALGLPGGRARFTAFALLTGDDPIEPGPHWLRPDLSIAELVRCLRRSAGRPRVQVTIPEGFTLWQIAERLGALAITQPAVFLDHARHTIPPGHADVSSWEGFLFPASYELYLNTTADKILAKLAGEMDRRWIGLSETKREAWQRLQADLGWSVKDVLTLASMVQAEGANVQEFPRIARVFLNRLREPRFHPRGMLQSDPTARYGCRLLAQPLASCGEGGGNAVTPQMLRDAANPYNTYRHSGLPPGPIGNPGAAAIAAVLEPADSRDLYFVADGRGGHRFSETYEQHLQAIRNPNP